MSSHTMTAFDADLSAIRSRVIDMGRRVREAAGNGIIALGERNLDLAQTLIGLDVKIDSMQREIETKAIETIARRLLAVDLREFVSAVHIVNDLERIGDLAKSICKRALVTDSAPLSKLLRGIRRVSVPVLNQLGLVLDSYAERDAAKALSVWSSDRSRLVRRECASIGCYLMSATTDVQRGNGPMHRLELGGEASEALGGVAAEDRSCARPPRTVRSIGRSIGSPSPWAR